MTKPNQFKALAAVAATALALCLLALVAVHPAEAAFPGKNGKIAFVSARDASGEIYTVSASGGTAARITFRTGGNVDPVWSPDGTRIAFSKGGQIAVMKASGMNSDGRGARLLTNSSTVKSEPTWSPDGTKIAFVANTRDMPDAGSDSEIWVINADGSGRKQLTDNIFEDTEPAWSPDGDQIAFVSTRRPEPFNDTDRNIYVMDANPATEEVAVNLTEAGQYDADTIYQGHDDHPTWSPSGDKIAYVHNFTANAGGRPNIWVMDPNGAMASRKNLQNDDSYSGLMPAWSPLGDKIAYVGVTGPNNNFDIYTMNSDGSVQAAIDTGDEAWKDEKPDWQPIPQCTDIVNANNDPLVGTAGDDVLCGDDRDNTINGAGGNDIILAGGGNDRLTGALGNDTLNGGPGTDTVLYPGSTAVRASLTTGFATGVGSDVLLAVENLTGSGANDRLTGSAVANALVGGKGADVLSGLGGPDKLNSKDGVNGNDTLNGGTGTDSCITDAREDSITSCP